MQNRMCKLLGFDPAAFKAADGLIIISQGNTVPTDAASGYAVGCMFFHRDGGAGTALYINEGTESSCDFNSAVSSILASQLYHNLSGQSYTVLKIHSHDTTAEIGSLETKGEFVNTSGLCLGQANYWFYKPSGDTGAPSQLSSGSFVVTVNASMTMTAGNMYALEGSAQLYGTMNGGAVNVAGVIGVISGNGANTQVLHMAGVQSAMGNGLVNPSTGTLSHYLANSASAVVIDNLLCMQASQYITNFASFNSAATDKCVEVNTGTPSGTIAHVIRVLIGGSAGYIPVYASKPS